MEVYMDYMITILIFAVAYAVVVIIAKNIASHQFKCHHCSKSFRITWIQVLTAMHSGNKYMLICPFCKTSDWCTEQPKNN